MVGKCHRFWVLNDVPFSVSFSKCQAHGERASEVPLKVLSCIKTTAKCQREVLICLCPRSEELRTQKLKPHLVITQSLNLLPLKPGVGQYTSYILRLLPGISSLFISTFPVHSPAFFPNSLPIFPVLAVANT